ncbi:MAG: hypothetical protein ABIR06_15020 [Cyclobacteriaceae bacterium]
MDDRLISVVDNYVRNGGRILTTGATSINDGSGKPLNNIRLQALGVLPAYENFPQAKSTYLKVSESDKNALGKREFKDFTIMMVYSDFLKCKPRGKEAMGFLRLVPETKFGPPEKSYFSQHDITDVPGVIANTFGKGKSVFIPWQLGTQYYFKGNYMHRALFVGALQNILKFERTIITDGSPLIEMSHMANRNKAFEWIGMINHTGQIGGSLREPVVIHNTTIRFKPMRPVKEIRLMRSAEGIPFTERNGWVECTIPTVKDFEMVVCLYR